MCDQWCRNNKFMDGKFNGFVQIPMLIITVEYFNTSHTIVHAEHCNIISSPVSTLPSSFNKSQILTRGFIGHSKEYIFKPWWQTSSRGTSAFCGGSLRSSGTSREWREPSWWPWSSWGAGPGACTSFLGGIVWEYEAPQCAVSGL